MKHNQKKSIFLLFLPLFFPVYTYATTQPKAFISGFAQAFSKTTNLPGVTVKVLETGQIATTTDSKGMFSFNYPIGQPLTLLFQKRGYKTSQSATYIVPKTGLKNITYQAIPRILFDGVLIARTWSGHPNLSQTDCQVITTVAAKGKTLYDKIQGEAGAVISITNSKKQTIHPDECYYGITPFKTTDPFCRIKSFFHPRITTSKDGGVFIANLKPDNVYTITAVKPGFIFSKNKVRCNMQWWQTLPDRYVFINLSPPNGPTVMGS